MLLEKHRCDDTLPASPWLLHRPQGAWGCKRMKQIQHRPDPNYLYLEVVEQQIIAYSF